LNASMTQYSFGGNRISILFSDGRICVRERNCPDDVLLVPPCGATCLQLNENGSILAIGTESGHIIIRDVKSQKQQILSNRVEKITALAFQNGQLYSAQAGTVSKWSLDLAKIEWSLKCESKKNDVSQIGFFGEQLVCASRKIKCYAKNNELAFEWPGHTHPCICLATVGDYLVTYGQDESSVAAWKAESEKTECRFQVTGKTRSINGTEKSVLVLNDISGSGHQLEIFAISHRSKPIKSKRSLNISDENGDPIELIGARFGAETTENVEIVYGLGGSLVWETVNVTEHCNIERTTYTKKHAARKEGEINGKHVHRVTGEKAVKKRRLESINETELSMAERLGLTNGIDDAPKAGSVTMILQQALHSRDKKQITAILRNKDTKLIKETVKHVPAQMAPVLVEEISSRLQVDPDRALATARWLRTTLQYHSAPLAAISRDVLESTRIPLDTRTTALSHLKRLQGKLELAIATANVSDDEDDDEDGGALVNENDITDIDDASHSESDWEPDFNPAEAGVASESGAESEAEPKRRKVE